VWASHERRAAVAQSAVRTQYHHFDDVSSRTTNVVENYKYPLRSLKGYLRNFLRVFFFFTDFVRQSNDWAKAVAHMIRLIIFVEN
jgi:hypothetical protein